MEGDEQTWLIYATAELLNGSFPVFSNFLGIFRKVCAKAILTFETRFDIIKNECAA